MRRTAIALSRTTLHKTSTQRGTSRSWFKRVRAPVGEIGSGAERGCTQHQQQVRAHSPTARREKSRDTRSSGRPNATSAWRGRRDPTPRCSTHIQRPSSNMQQSGCQDARRLDACCVFFATAPVPPSLGIPHKPRPHVQRNPATRNPAMREARPQTSPTRTAQLEPHNLHHTGPNRHDNPTNHAPDGGLHWRRSDRNRLVGTRCEAGGEGTMLHLLRADGGTRASQSCRRHGRAGW